MFLVSHHWFHRLSLANRGMQELNTSIPEVQNARGHSTAYYAGLSNDSCLLTRLWKFTLLSTSGDLQGKILFFLFLIVTREKDHLCTDTMRSASSKIFIENNRHPAICTQKVSFYFLDHEPNERNPADKCTLSFSASGCVISLCVVGRADVNAQFIYKWHW
jgi:hypothetical protein